MTGGGNNLKKRAKSKSYLSKTLKITKFVSKKLEDFHSATSGSILIEFAVCMPVLIILLYYINDLSKLKRYYDQTEFVAQQMVNILQNIAYTRLQEGNTISLLDIKRAASLAYLSIYPGTTMFTTKLGSNYHVFNHKPRIYMYYVKNNSDGTASVPWRLWIHSGDQINPNDWSHGYLKTTSPQSLVTVATNVPPSSIYPNLKMDDGNPRIIVEVQIRWDKNDQKDANGKTAYSAREVFKLFAVNVKSKHKDKADYFTSVVTFTPNDGFTVNQPQ